MTAEIRAVRLKEAGNEEMVVTWLLIDVLNYVVMA